MPRRYVRKTAPGTVRPRDEKGRLLPAGAVAAQPPSVEAAPRPKDKPKKKPKKQKRPRLAQPQQAAPVAYTWDGETWTARTATGKAKPEPRPAQADGLYPGPATWERLKEMAKVIHASTMKPGWMMSEEQVLTTLLRGYEMRVGPTQVIWNTFLGDDGRPLNTAELMRALVLRSGKGYLRPVVRTNEEVTYEGCRYGIRGDGTDDVKLSVTWRVGDLASGPRVGLPRQTLDAKATSELCRTLFADIAGGYTPEDFDLVPARQAGPGGGVPVEAPPSQPEASPQPTPTPPAAVAPEAPSEQLVAAPQEPAAASSAPEPPPVSTPTPPEASAGAYEEVAPGRVLSRLVALKRPTGEVTPVYTAGISADQVAEIYRVAGDQYQEAAQRWLGAHGVKKLSWCTEAEGDELIAYLRQYATTGNGEPVKPPAPDRTLTFARADAVFEKEVTKLGLSAAQCRTYLANKHGLANFTDLLPEQVIGAAEDFKALAAADLAAFKLAFAREVDRMGIDPSGGYTAP